MNSKKYIPAILLLSLTLFSCSDKPEPPQTSTPQELVSGNYNLTMIVDIPGVGRLSEDVGLCVIKQSTSDANTLLLQTYGDETMTLMKLSDPKLVGQNVAMKVLYQVYLESFTTEGDEVYIEGDKGVSYEGGVYDALWFKNSGNIEISTRGDVYSENEYVGTYAYLFSLTPKK